MEDLDEIMKIERESFPVAWEYSIFLNICLHNGKVASGGAGVLVMDVLEMNNTIQGYAVWEIDTSAASGHILNFAIRSDARRKGKGTMLVKHIIQDLRNNGIRSCRLEVRESNKPARRLYESCGFVASSTILGYYFDEDAIVYSLNP